MRIIYASQHKTLPLGRVGENDCTKVVFDTIKPWLSEYPNARIILLNRPSGIQQSYPAIGIDRVGDDLVWTIKSSDVCREGHGECELIAIENEVIIKSACWGTIVSYALDGSGEAPDPISSWQTKLLEITEDAEDAIQEAKDVANHLPKIVDDEWYVWDMEIKDYVSTGISVQGPGFTFEDDGMGIILKAT